MTEERKTLKLKEGAVRKPKAVAKEQAQLEQPAPRRRTPVRSTKAAPVVQAEEAEISVVAMHYPVERGVKGTPQHKRAMAMFDVSIGKRKVADFKRKWSHMSKAERLNQALQNLRA